MCIGGSLHVSHEFGLFSSNGRTKMFKDLEIRSRGHIISSFLSSRTSRQSAWGPHVSNKSCEQIQCLSSRHKSFSFRAFAASGHTSGITLLQIAGSNLSRSYTALNEIPLTVQLVKAIGIIAFALWGLEPLMRHSRNLLLHQSDNNWKNSRGYGIFTSYLQPVLIWTGVTLICRALEPVSLLSETSQAVKQRVLNFIRSLSTVLAFAYCLSRLIQQVQKFFLESKDIPGTRNMGFQFAGKAVYSAVWVAALSLFMELLGFSTKKWITAGGLGTVLLTLAGREILTNFLSSIMIHATRPFVLNEWIQTKIEGYDVSGNVEHVGWWSPTIVRGEDREAVHIPNHQFTVNVVRNLSQKTHWRIKTHLSISHLDVNKIKSIVADMRKVLAKNPQVEQQRLHRRVFLDNIDPENQSLLILVSCFVKTSHFEEYLCVKESILLDLLRVIRHHRARLATLIRTVQRTYGIAGAENATFSETVIARRPLLMLEAPSRINGGSKTKTHMAPSLNEERLAKTAATEPMVTQIYAVTGSAPSDKQHEGKKSSGEDVIKSNKGGTSTSTQSSSLSEENTERPGVKGSASRVGYGQPDSLQVADIEQCDGIPPKLNIMHGSENSPDLTSVTKPAMEVNIVLGMSLEGSKRTLPLEQEMLPETIDDAEAKEEAASHTASGPTPLIKDRRGYTAETHGQPD